MSPSKALRRGGLIPGLRAREILFILLLTFALWRISPFRLCLNSSPGQSEIPNIVHYVWVLPEASSDLRFEFKHFLSIYTAQHFLTPDRIYFHTNADEESVSRARKGKAGKWSKLILELPKVHLRQVTSPSQAGNGVQITFTEHKADFIRAEALHRDGGLYLDWDVYPLRDVTSLRRAGFQSILGRVEGRQQQINSGTLFSVPRSKMSRLYLEGMHRVYDGQYVTHSNNLLTAIVENLTPQPGEILILDQNAFTPGSWLPTGLNMLYGEQTEQGDNNDARKDERASSLSGKPESLVGPRRSFSDSYMIHAFQPGVRNIPDVPGFEHISPRWVLESRSNFARALRGVAWDLYNRGFIEMDDSFDGR